MYMASAGARAYNGGLEAEPPPPEAERRLSLTFHGAAKFVFFLYFAVFSRPVPYEAYGNKAATPK